ncbi:hypothetical protein [Dyadobacter frigoris]|uniref:Uncharacterized protein n=1 Tax=Dyadobacter frigoris TaxID=2576211 RepID=A0A4U6CXQ0_9BACT|nr:hypothetical protein [Dyadobacter frigoris]TKT89482.1 hypothetical protein FDK13_24375 [Dyadobacter frigoris]
MINLILVIFAIISSIICIPIGFVFEIISAFRYERSRKKIYLYLSKVMRGIAICIDMLGNACCGAFFNAILITKGGYYFGRTGETISSALGKNQLKGTLTKAGNFLANILDWIDDEHCFNSIQEF